MEIVVGIVGDSVDRNKKRALYLFTGLLIFFLGLLAACGVGVYNDSQQ